MMEKDKALEEEVPEEENVSAEDSKKEDEESQVNLLNSDSSSEYFDDDLEVIEPGEDHVLYEDESQAAFKQIENVVIWQITGLYEDDDPKRKVRNRTALRADPPKIIITSNKDDDYAIFNLTREVSKSLADSMGKVYKAHYGVKPTNSKPITQDSIKERVNDSKKWIVENKVKSGIIGFVILLALVFYFFL